ncbi:16S rRNA (guanine(527)-N(7))-methyltransferase RsmG [bacterium]|nr:16S rRNA (guanine(527)-N(7))-methyltransferase RsmG [bacterium]
MVHKKKKLETYIKLLKDYNEHTNIYSKKAYDVLEFHIQDSLTLAKIITNSPTTLFDFGSGSGLPSIPIAIQNDQNTIYAIESKSRKTRFLKTVKQELNLNNISIVHQNLFEWTPLKSPHIITAKAFASLEKIETIIKKLHLKNVTIYIPISKNQQEIYKNNKSVTFVTNNNYVYLKKTI